MRRETDEQFDHGGTRAWRANQATWRAPPRVIDVAPAGPIARAVAWFNRTPFYALALWVIFLGFVLPWLVIIVPISVMALLNINPG